MAKVVALSKKRIAPRRIETVSIDDTATVSIWVEKGRVEVRRQLTGEPIALVDGAGAVALGVGPVHLRCVGKDAAVVFVAIADGEPAAAEIAVPEPIGAEPPDVAHDLPFDDGPPATAAPDFGGSTAWNAVCTDPSHNVLNNVDLTFQEAENLCIAHEDPPTSCALAKPQRA
jgi:hypothetical protein